MNTVIKPISLFLNDVEKNISSRIIKLMLKALVIMTSLIKATCLCTHHRKVRISLPRMTCVTFSHKGVPFKDSFQVENGKVIHVAETFITKKSTALLVDDERYIHRSVIRTMRNTLS
jgi:hypothetical protein